jgi:hypothetical protein
MPRKLSTSVTRPGDVSSLARALRRLLAMISLCKFIRGRHARTIMTERHRCSRNITHPNTPGYMRRDDPAYLTIPPDSRKPPAPIDPSGEYPYPSREVPQLTARDHSLKMVLYLLCDCVEQIVTILRTNDQHCERLELHDNAISNNNVENNMTDHRHVPHPWLISNSQCFCFSAEPSIFAGGYRQ